MTDLLLMLIPMLVILAFVASRYLVRRFIEGCSHKYSKWSDPVQTYNGGYKQQWRACIHCNKAQFRTLLWDKQTSIVAIQNALDRIKKESPAK